MPGLATISFTMSLHSASTLSIASPDRSTFSTVRRFRFHSFATYPLACAAPPVAGRDGVPKVYCSGSRCRAGYLRRPGADLTLAWPSSCSGSSLRETRGSHNGIRHLVQALLKLAPPEGDRVIGFRLEGRDRTVQGPSRLVGALLGGVTSLPLLGLLFLGTRIAGLPFVPFDLFDGLARALPGGVVTLFIDAMVKAIQLLKLGETSEVAKLVEQVMALGLVVLSGILFGVILAWALGRGSRPGWLAGSIGGLALFLLVAAVELGREVVGDLTLALLWMAPLILGWGALLGTWLGTGTPRGGRAAREEGYRPDRRAALAKIAAGSLAVALAAGGLGRLLQEERRGTGADEPLPPHAPAAPTPTESRIEPAPGTRPELTPNEDFFRIDINLRPPVVSADSWVLEVEGLFDNPRPLTLSDLLAYPAVTQPITLACISNPIGGDLIGTSNWTGVRLIDLLRDLGLRPEARELFVAAADGFYESVAMADLSDPRVLLVYGMNGKTLPVEHGFPLRIYIPNRYGMKQPKWITRLEAIDRERLGYWVERGWSKEARPQILSIIDVVAKDQVVEGRASIGGIAWAGDRGIQKVEVQVDGGLWEEAALRTPPLSPLTWVQWRYDWPLVAGRHTFRVRATDGTGALQIEQVTDTHPDGATGYHTVTHTF